MDFLTIKKIVGDCSAEIFGRRFFLEAHMDPLLPLINISIMVRSKIILEDGPSEEITMCRSDLVAQNFKTKDDVIMFMLGMFQDFMLHEAMETFQYQGKQYRNPHKAA